MVPYFKSVLNALGDGLRMGRRRRWGKIGCKAVRFFLSLGLKKENSQSLESSSRKQAFCVRGRVDLEQKASPTSGEAPEELDAVYSGTLG